jgi:hypothetical protein
LVVNVLNVRERAADRSVQGDVPLEEVRPRVALEIDRKHARSDVRKLSPLMIYTGFGGLVKLFLVV